MSQTLYLRVLIHPERANISISTEFSTRVVSDGNLFEGEFTFQINSPSFIVKFESSNEYDIYMIRNYAKYAVESLLLPIVFEHAIPLRCEVDQFSVDGKNFQNYSLRMEFINSVDSEIKVSAIEIYGNEVINNAFYIQGVGDLRDALDNPDQTGPLCYRSVECIMQYFKTKLKLGHKNDGSAWAEMHKVLGTTKEEIDFMMPYAEFMRHGNYIKNPSITDENRAKIYSIAWNTFGKFTRFLMEEKVQVYENPAKKI